MLNRIFYHFRLSERNQYFGASEFVQEIIKGAKCLLVFLGARSKRYNLFRTYFGAWSAGYDFHPFSFLVNDSLNFEEIGLVVFCQAPQALTVQSSFNREDIPTFSGADSEFFEEFVGHST